MQNPEWFDEPGKIVFCNGLYKDRIGGYAFLFE